MAGKPFRFPLQAVLDVRQREAETAERNLARAAARRREAERRLADAERALAEAVPPSTPLAMRRYGVHRNALRDALDAARTTASQTRGAELAALKELHARQRPKEALLTLADSARSAHESEALAAEQNALDEHATTAYWRKAQAA